MAKTAACISYAVLFATFLVCVGGILAVVVTLAISSDKPSFPILEFQINSAFVNPFNVSNSHLTAYWDFSIIIKKIDTSPPLICQDVKASVSLNNVLVSSTQLQNLSFSDTYLGNSRWYGVADEKNFQVNFVSSGVPINQTSIEDGIRDGFFTLSFNFSYTGSMKVDKRSSEKVKDVTVLCENLKVASINNYSYIQGSFPLKCAIHNHQ
ncbi:hypothetical protein M5689_008220 [Euphorbia peplus]|nr:hypothetical protein M5689_008220 [Euphorbia peplus]